METASNRLNGVADPEGATLHRKSAPLELQGPQAPPHVEEPVETFPPDFPMRSSILAPPDEVLQPIPYDDSNASS